MSEKMQVKMNYRVKATEDVDSVANTIEDIGQGKSIDCWNDSNTILYLCRNTEDSEIRTNGLSITALVEDEEQDDVYEEEEDNVYRLDPITNEWVLRDSFGEYEEISQEETYSSILRKIKHVLRHPIIEIKTTIITEIKTAGNETITITSSKTWTPATKKQGLVTGHVSSNQPRGIITIGHKEKAYEYIAPHHSQREIKRNRIRNQESKKNNEKLMFVRKEDEKKVLEKEKKPVKQVVEISLEEKIQNLEMDIGYYEMRKERANEKASDAIKLGDFGGNWEYGVEGFDKHSEEVAFYTLKMKEARDLLRDMKERKKMEDERKAEEEKRREEDEKKAQEEKMRLAQAKIEIQQKMAEKKRKDEEKQRELSEEEEEVLRAMMEKKKTELPLIKRKEKKNRELSEMVKFNFSSEIAKTMDIRKGKVEVEEPKVEKVIEKPKKLEIVFKATKAKKGESAMAFWEKKTPVIIEELERLQSPEQKRENEERKILKDVPELIVPPSPAPSVVSVTSVNNEKSRMCVNAGKCMYGNKCKFAHFFSELIPSMCRADMKCGLEKCMYMHSNETKESYAKRMGWKDVEPVVNVKSMMCPHVLNCKFGEKCKYAHTMDELTPCKCRADEKCTHDNCKYMHSNETKEGYGRRMGWIREVVKVRENNEKSMMCSYGVGCKRKVCSFAHNLTELNPLKCVRTGCDMSRCKYMHSNETKEMYAKRMGWM
jgi:hypothetical protein